MAHDHALQGIFFHGQFLQARLDHVADRHDPDELAIDAKSDSVFFPIECTNGPTKRNANPTSNPHWISKPGTQRATEQRAQSKAHNFEQAHRCSWKPNFRTYPETNATTNKEAHTATNSIAHSFTHAITYSPSYPKPNTTSDINGASPNQSSVIIVSNCLAGSNN